jgi:adenylate kinase family enzyme
VLVAGTSGSGKSTLARRLAGLLDAPYHELDGLYHGPSWTPRSSFVDEVDAFSAEPAWVTEWQYSAVRPMLVERADLLVYLLFSRTLVMRRMVVRTVRRRLRREVLWNGNTEPPFRTFFHDREHIVRWAWSTHPLQWGRFDLLAEH